MWLAQEQIASAKSAVHLEAPLRLLEWAVDRADTTGALGEQFHVVSCIGRDHLATVFVSQVLLGPDFDGTDFLALALHQCFHKIPDGHGIFGHTVGGVVERRRLHNADEQFGIRIILESCFEPIRKIAENCGEKADVIINSKIGRAHV